VHRFVYHGPLFRPIYEIHQRGHHRHRFPPDRYVEAGPVERIPVYPPDPFALCRSQPRRVLAWAGQYALYMLVGVPLAFVPAWVLTRNPLFTACAVVAGIAVRYSFIRVHDVIHYPADRWIERQASCARLARRVKYAHRGWISAPKARGWRRRRDGRPLEVSIAPADRPGRGSVLPAKADRHATGAGGDWIQIGPTFSRDLSAGRPADVQTLLDGRRSNASQIVSGYLSQIIGDVAADSSGAGRPPRAELVTRNWFNPNLEYTWFVVPGLIAIIAMLVGLIVTGLSVARERELGTFDQLMVSPLRSREILVGKVIPPLLIGISHITVYILVAVLIFRIPLRGSLFLLYGSAILYLAAVVGVGLFISSLCATQQQAILGSFLFIAPATLLSGFATPIENMPEWLQPLTLLDPLRYFLVITRGVS
jgi:ABC-type multidrug transport system permease subunit